MSVATNTKVIRIEGRLKEIFPQTEREIRKHTHKGKNLDGYYRNHSMIVIGMFMIVFVMINVMMFTDSLNIWWAIPLFGLALSIIIIANYTKHPKKVFRSLMPAVDYAGLEELMQELLSRFPEKEVVVEIYTDYKTKKITEQFIKESKRIISLFGRKYLIFSHKKPIVIEFSVSKWRIIFPDEQLEFSLRQKVRIVSETIQGSSGKHRQQCKVNIKTKFFVKKPDTQESFEIGKWRQKYGVRIPKEYILKENGKMKIREIIAGLFQA